jgi:hypothetical protein
MEGKPPDDAATGLERELYWAEKAKFRSLITAAEGRDGLLAFADRMRDDERQRIPRGEPNLAARERWKRQVKYRFFGLLRPVSSRYDRLLGDLSELCASLADSVAMLEAEVARLREELERREGGG